MGISSVGGLGAAGAIAVQAQGQAGAAQLADVAALFSSLGLGASVDVTA